MDKKDYPRCKTCKFWNATGFTKVSKTGICDKAGTSYKNSHSGYSDAVNFETTLAAAHSPQADISYMHAFNALSKFEGDRYVQPHIDVVLPIAELRTKYNFGCIQHEPKELKNG